MKTIFLKRASCPAGGIASSELAGVLKREAKNSTAELAEDAEEETEEAWKQKKWKLELRGIPDRFHYFLCELCG